MDVERSVPCKEGGEVTFVGTCEPGLARSRHFEWDPVRREQRDYTTGPVVLPGPCDESSVDTEVCRPSVKETAEPP